MPATTSGQLTVEKTPSYLVSGRVVERIFAMDPAVRLLVVVRDPVTRAVSDYTQAATKRPDIVPFEQLAFVARNVSNSELGQYIWLSVRPRNVMPSPTTGWRKRKKFGNRVDLYKYFFSQRIRHIEQSTCKTE